jgi:hypothetical protein
MEGKFVFLTHKSPRPCTKARTKIFLIFYKKFYLTLKKVNYVSGFA